MSCTVVDEAAIIAAEVAADRVAEASPAPEFSVEESDLIKAEVAADLASDALHDKQVADWDHYWSHR